MSEIGFICKRRNCLEPKSLEYILSELTLSSKKWICYNIYRPPSSQHLEVSSKELTDSLSKVTKSTKISLLWVILVSHMVNMIN